MPWPGRGSELLCRARVYVSAMMMMLWFLVPLLAQILNTQDPTWIMDYSDELDAVRKYYLDNILQRASTDVERPEDTFLSDILEWIRKFYEEVVSKDFRRFYNLLRPPSRMDLQFRHLRDAIAPFAGLLALRAFGWELEEVSSETFAHIHDIAAHVLALRLPFVKFDRRLLIEYANDYADRECHRSGHRLFPRTQIHQQRSEVLPGLEESFLTFHNRFSARTTSTPAQCSIAPSERSSALTSNPLVNTLPRPNSARQSSTRSAPQAPRLQPSDRSWSDQFESLPLAIVTNTLPEPSMAGSSNRDENDDHILRTLYIAPDGVTLIPPRYAPGRSCRKKTHHIGGFL
ncbi:hypothetical protein HD553DRAFT_325077 [Filobasidium floriforme]|uniref:uncharacterized protein n=1 Tax=Filobasidium floriforme TaxID=5210 RepID=UPI001E8E16FF|nr:uncharacterized protein HD553DRAFT_325077 [Filobasidium floriforme]KAH8082220.1 hypothetical protein HD553DRAFT_325077 [Filobasidium floriforme]